MYILSTWRQTDTQDSCVTSNGNLSPSSSKLGLASFLSFFHLVAPKKSAGKRDPPLFTITSSSSSRLGPGIGMDQTVPRFTTAVFGQHPNSVPSKYWPSSTLLDFSDRMRTNVSKLASRCAQHNTAAYQLGNVSYDTTTPEAKHNTLSLVSIGMRHS